MFLKGLDHAPSPPSKVILPIMSGLPPPAAPERALDRLERLRAQSAGKSVISMSMAKGSGHLLVDHVLIREVLTSKTFIRPAFLRRAFGEGLLFAEGERWEVSRRTLQPMLTPRCIRDFAPLVGRFVGELREEWLAAARSGEEVDVVSDLAGTVMRSSVASLFGVDLGAHDPRAISVIRLSGASNQLAGLGVFDPKKLIDTEMTTVLREERANLEALAHEIVGKRRSDPEAHDRSDMLTSLLDTEFLDATVEDGCPIGEKGLLDELVLLLLASVETTTASTANAIELLGRNPDALKRLRAEVDGDDRSREHPYTTSCFRESLRIRPPVWFNGRYALERVELSNGHVIEKGGYVFICPYLVHHDPDLWEEPDVYRPERFLDGNVREGGEFMPFGLGHHYCVGSGLATLIGTEILAGVLGCLDVSILDRPTEEPVDGFLLGPALGSTARLSLPTR
jgi:cytochrome P450